MKNKLGFFFLTLSMMLAQNSITLEAVASENDLDVLVEKLKTKRETVRTWIPFCEDGTQSHGVCPFADMTIFSGMSCLSGEAERCIDVKRAQGPDGRWWRSPSVVSDDTVKNTFSRDQSKGALAYLVATKDVEAAKRWEAYLNSNKLKMCKDTTDNRCHITSGTGRLFGAVWTYLGLKKASWMEKGEGSAEYVDQVMARFQPDNFPMHLNATNIWIRREIERRGGPKAEEHDQKTLKILVKREPKNPYFLMLRKGPTVEVAKLILEKCPDIRPEAVRLDWAWQRGQDDMPWKVSSGHECIFIINMFERELALQTAAN